MPDDQYPPADQPPQNQPPQNSPYGQPPPSYGQQGQQQPPYGQPPPPGQQPPYGQPSPYGQPPAWPPPPGGYYAPVPQAPPVNATLILVFGILGIVLAPICGIGGAFGPIAWIMGNSALTTLSQIGDPMNQSGTVKAGRICGMVGTAFMVIYFLFIIASFGFGIFSSIRHPQGGILMP